MKEYTNMPKRAGRPWGLAREDDTPFFSPIAMCMIARMIVVANTAERKASKQLQTTKQQLFQVKITTHIHI